MISCLGTLLVALLSTQAFSHSNPKQQQFSKAHLEELEEIWGFEWGFSGISTFAHLPHIKCLTQPQIEYDIAILGVPFDTAVSYRPGARFGPRAIRAGSARQTSFRGFNARAGVNPYREWAKIIDCGDVPVTPFDNALALHQMSEAYVELGKRSPTEKSRSSSVSYHKIPKVLTLGGDHSIALPALRALKRVYDQPITVVHFDAHLDTWHPAKYPNAWIDAEEGPFQSNFNHGSMFWMAATEGLIANSSSVHAGLRTRLADLGDYEDDTQQGWERISTDDIDDVGPSGIIYKIMKHVGTEKPVYLSIDIDVIDPGLAPGTGTPEPGGWSTRELIRILRGIEGLNVVGADIVEVSPAYDGNEVTALAAAQVAFEVLTSMVKRGMAAEGGGAGHVNAEKDEL
ncbi:Arginase/deacetylase [Aulographum hederae CBS 113979]|uniref:agmatinase n=1 Tax=Aulographum hederae CBS 113979 TaxID=1176131 RepID=A0A6G1GK69_9PEZI|nr:Arginase/deacetylase [Aulographum hederae CBS 113979]